MHRAVSRGRLWVAAVLLQGCGHDPEPVAAPPAEACFADATARSGVDFINVCGSPGKEHILDSMGAGVALFDYDADGDLDLYFAQGSTRERVLAGDNTASDRLYRNDGGLHFTDVTQAALPSDLGWSNGCAVADVDGDGALDLYVTHWGPNVLYRNRGDGTFVDVTAAAGVGDPRWSTSAAFADYDLDGDLDLYVANYLQFDWNDPPPPGQSWKGVPSYYGPQGLVPQRDALLRNDGSGVFEDVSVTSGIDAAAPAYALAVTWFDAEDDGDPDLYVANDTTPNYLFRNTAGHFDEIGVTAGLAYNADGAAQAGMGVAVGDADGDGRQDLFVTNFSFDFNTLYAGLGSLLWDATAARGELRMASHHPMGWGTLFADVDADGDLDLAVANGQLYPAIDQSPSLRDICPYRQRNHLFLNDGAALFREVSTRAGDGFALRQCSRGLAAGDLDDDGDVDLVVTNIDDRPAILENTGRQGHWLEVRLEQPGGNRFAVGARVLVTTAAGSQRRDVQGAYSYLCHNDLRAHFGLGEAATATVAVVWPDGVRQELGEVAADQLLVVRRGTP